MMLDHIGGNATAARPLKAIERATADPVLPTPDLGGSANARKVTDAVVTVIRAENA